MPSGQEVVILAPVMKTIATEKTTAKRNIALEEDKEDKDEKNEDEFLFIFANIF